MSEKSRAKKLAAAKKKLKEYQTKEKLDKYFDTEVSETIDYGSEKKNEEEINTFLPDLQSKEDENNPAVTQDQHQMNFVQENEDLSSSISDYFMKLKSTVQPDHQSEKCHVNAIEILIAEKAALTAELSKQQNMYKEKLLETEELMVKLQITLNRNKVLEDDIKELHFQNTTMKNELENMSKQFNEQKEDFERQKIENNEMKDHLKELKQELSEEHKKNAKLEHDLKEKLCELELSYIRINQISDEANFASDNRVEALTQTKFMHEQQIRDLQAMVQQLTTERDQANQQYQNYVQHLNKEMTSISEKNSELNIENEKLSSREKTLIEHISSLEKQIQENIAKQESLKEKINQNSQISLATDDDKLSLEIEVKNLNEENSNLKSEIQGNKDEIQKISICLNEKNERIAELEEKIENILLDRPDNKKLLEIMESDKIAASIAVTQNEELKKQLEEVQQKLIQVTNDKVELVNLLDSEQYANRKIRENYEEMEKNLREINEKLHFKDEEMIRLTHENSELNKKILQLNQTVDRLMHYEAKEYIRQKEETHLNAVRENDDSVLIESNHKIKNETTDDHVNEQNVSNCNHDTEYDKHSNGINDQHLHFDHNHSSDENNCEMSCKASYVAKQEHRNDEVTENHIISGMPINKAMEKLQDRFKKLMTEVADLTDEKQRLEHLVLQLQGETETIGEYITLYQTQRRLLKQREIEKTTQLHMLLSEREEMKEKMSSLTQLIEDLAVEFKYGACKHLSQILTVNNMHSDRESNKNPTRDDSTNLTPKENENSIDFETNPIFSKIHNLIAEIKEKEDNLEANLKFVPSVDHCACCSGKFETV